MQIAMALRSKRAQIASTRVHETCLTAYLLRPENIGVLVALAVAVRSLTKAPALASA